MTDPQLGAWLRRERKELRAWSQAEMARRLIRAAREDGDNSMPGTDNVKRLLQSHERDGCVSLRYRRLYCKAFGIELSRFGRPSDAPAVVDPLPPASPAVIYRERQDPFSGFPTAAQEVLMAAHESGDHAAEYEQHGIGEVTSEQLRADLIRLSRMTDAGPPLSAFLEMRRIRDRIYHLLDRRLWPREQTDLYLLLGCINGLMGITANRLGYPDAAEELIRSGWVYANAIDHHPLRGLLRAKLSTVMYWRGRFSESHDLAVDGLRYISQGPLGANLHTNQARAAARTGDPDTARRAVGLALTARDSDYHDDLTQIGGEEFALSRATTRAKAGGALAETANDVRQAETELQAAISLYDQEGTSNDQHWFGGKALAGMDLAIVRMQSGALDGAKAVLAPVLALPPEQRVSTVTTRLARVRDELAAPIFQGSPQARDLGERIEAFGREAVTAGLHSLTG